MLKNNPYQENPDAAERQTVDTVTTQEIGDEAIDYSDNEDSGQNSGNYVRANIAFKGRNLKE